MKKKIKNVLMLVFILAVAVLALWFAKDFFVKNSQPAEQPNSEQQQEQQQPVVEANPQTELVQIKQDVDNYTIDVKYPEFSGLSNVQAMTDVNSLLKNKMEKSVSDFKQDIAENSAKELSSKSTLSNIYEIAIFTNEFVSIKFNTLYYVVGMTQPSNYEEIFNYNFKDNREITLSDLFNYNSNYLSELSTLSAEDLKNQLKPADYSKDMVAAGTEAKESNFSNFVFTKSMLVVIFNSGQVAPFAAGIKYVDLPWIKMADINKDSALLKLIEK